jgi:hypothetical protein
MLEKFDNSAHAYKSTPLSTTQSKLLFATLISSAENEPGGLSVYTQDVHFEGNTPTMANILWVEVHKNRVICSS